MRYTTMQVMLIIAAILLGWWLYLYTYDKKNPK